MWCCIIQKWKQQTQRHFFCITRMLASVSPVVTSCYAINAIIDNDENNNNMFSSMMLGEDDRWWMKHY